MDQTMRRKRKRTPNFIEDMQIDVGTILGKIVINRICKNFYPNTNSYTNKCLSSLTLLRFDFVIFRHSTGYQSDLLSKFFLTPVYVGIVFTYLLITHNRDHEYTDTSFCLISPDREANPTGGMGRPAPLMPEILPGVRENRNAVAAARQIGSVFLDTCIFLNLLQVKVT